MVSNIDPRTGKPKIILDLCGGTGSWSRPYKDAGYDVRVITLPDYDVLIYEPPENVYGILAAPPCTEFSIAKGNKPRDLADAILIVNACLSIIQKCRPTFWALENPVGLLRQYIGKPSMTFQQWQFGAAHIKPTDLWGYYNPPIPTVRQRPKGLTIKVKGASSNGRLWSKPVCPPEYKGYISQFKGDAKRAVLRAITPPGFAQAFFKANK